MNALLFSLGYLYFLGAPVLIWLLIARPSIRGFRLPRVLPGLALAALTLLAYARFIEPRLLVVKEHAIALEGCFAEGGAARLAVFSDPHIGVFRNAMPIDRIARAIEPLGADAVMIAGDFTLHLGPKQFEAAFRPIARLPIPVFYVLGNHDVGQPGPLLQDELTAALDGLGLANAETRPGTHGFANGHLEIVGLSGVLWGETDIDGLQPRRNAVPPAPRIVLVHSPDIALELPPAADFDLLIAGHTHGGQINLGSVTCFLVRMACHVVREGVVDAPIGSWRSDYADNPAFHPAGAPLTRQVFVTTGTGMSGLPLRFNMPPRIDVLNITYTACSMG